MQDTQQSTLIVVPTLDLMHQWYAHLVAVFPDAPVGLFRGGAHYCTPLLVATYERHADRVGASANDPTVGPSCLLRA
jgi:superfamily II DNA or RNA helicase